MIRQVPASYWALIGKTPGTRDDYSVLWDNGSTESRVIRAWSGIPSTPQLGGTPGPGQLPWATFTPHAADGQHWMAATVIDATKDRDGVGRPIAAIRYVEFPFAEFARDGADCAALFRSLPGAVTLETSNPSKPPCLDLDGADAAVARALDHPATFDRAAKLAACLLQGPVLITLPETGLLPIRDRLKEFDRILALLPFGLRCAVTIASWQDGTQPTPFRLAFGRVPSHGQTLVPYGDSDIPSPRDGTPAEYLHDLMELRDRYGIGRIVRHLASHRWPLSLSPGDVSEAREILRCLAMPHAVVVAARARTASADRIAVAWRSANGKLSQDERDELHSALLAMGGSAAEQAVRDNWSPRTARLAARVVLDELAKPVEYADLGPHRWSPSLWRLRARAAQADSTGGNRVSDAFLATLAASRAEHGSTIPDATIASCLDGVPPNPGGFQELRAALLRQPSIARWLLRYGLRRDIASVGWVEWLSPEAADAHNWLRRYSVLTAMSDMPGLLYLPAGGQSTRSETRESDTVGKLEDLVLIAWLTARGHSFARLAEDWWPVLIRVARGRGGAMPPDDSVEPGANRARADLGFLVSLKEIIGKTPDDLQTNTRVDTLRLYLGLRPAHYPLDGGSESARRYLNSLWAAWSLAPADEDVSLLTVWLIAAVFGGTRRYPRAAVDPQTEFAVTLLSDVVTDRRIPLTRQVADAIASAVAMAPGLHADPRLSPEWWARIERLRPDIRTPEARLRAALRQTAPPIDPAEIAVLAGKAVLDGRAVEELAAVIGPWLARHPQAVRDALFRIIEGVVRLEAAETGRSFDDYLTALASRLGITEEKSGILRRRRQ